MNDIDSVYFNFWGKQKPKFTEMEIALMEGGHSVENPVEGRMEFIKSLVINENNARAAALAWIDKVYAMYPTVMQNNHVMMWGEGENQQFAMFELSPSFSRRGAVEVKWFQAYPLRQGVGSKAMAELQRLAREDGITLTLFPWDKGQVSQTKLTKFYKGHGFKPTVAGSKSLHWVPDGSGTV